MIREHNVIESASEPDSGTPVALTGPVYRIDISPLEETDDGDQQLVIARLKWPGGPVAVEFFFASQRGGGWSCPGPDCPILGPVELSLSGGRGKFSFITNDFVEG